MDAKATTRYLALYPAVLKKLASTRKDGQRLIDLDEWFWKELPKTVAERGVDQGLTKKELQKVTEWKLERGKTRPRLKTLVASNDSAEVERVTRKAATRAMEGDIVQAVETLCELKGIGPATATAIACAFTDNIAFLADETMEMLKDRLGKVDYTIKYFRAFHEEINNITASLNEDVDADTKSGPYSCKDFGQSLWSQFHCKKLSLDDENLSGSKEPATDLKRKSDTGDRHVKNGNAVDRKKSRMK